MKRKYVLTFVWWLPVAVALAGLFLWLGALTGQAAQPRPLPAPPLLQEERLWAEVGLNDAWYVMRGNTDVPPLRSAPAHVSLKASPVLTSPPHLVLHPASVEFLAYADQSGVLSATVSVSDDQGMPQGWVAQLAPGGAFTPTLVPTSGLPGQGLILLVDSGPYAGGTLFVTHTRRITVSAAFTDTRTAAPSPDALSQAVLTVSLYVDPHLPRLWVDASEVRFRDGTASPGVYTRTIRVRNAGGYTLAWQTQVLSMGLTPLVTPTSGVQEGWITVTVDGRDYPSDTAVYTGGILVHAKSGTAQLYPVLDAPWEIAVHLEWVDYALYLPRVMQSAPGSLVLPPTPTATPAPTATATATPISTTPAPEREVRAIWITRYDWTSAYAPEGPGDIDAMVANVADAGFNTVFFQVRAHGDAYYTPGLEPWSARLDDAGVLGQDPGWDPLARMIEQAHARGVRVQAYVNVYPAWLGTAAPLQGIAPAHPFWTWSGAYGWADWRQWSQGGGPMSLNSAYLWASPGVDGVRDHIVNVVADIVTRYSVDGVHLDLVRYAGGAYSFDPISDAAAGTIKTAARDQWQRDQVNDLVSRIYTVLQTVRPAADLSAAVWFCYYPDGCGYGLSSGYADYYQDALGWLSSGIIDAIAPMLYGWSGFEDLEVWRNVMLQFQDANAGRHVYPGISADFDDFGAISARIQAARAAGTAGHAVFSYGAIEAHGYWDDFVAGPYAQPARLYAP